MSIITIRAKLSLSIKGTFRLHKLLDIPISEVKSRVNSGLPLFDDELFDNNYTIKAELLRKILSVAQDEQVPLEISESLSNLDSQHHKKSSIIISQYALENILKSTNEDTETSDIKSK